MEYHCVALSNLEGETMTEVISREESDDTIAYEVDHADEEFIDEKTNECIETGKVITINDNEEGDQDA